MTTLLYPGIILDECWFIQLDMFAMTFWQRSQRIPGLEEAKILHRGHGDNSDGEKVAARSELEWDPDMTASSSSHLSFVTLKETRKNNHIIFHPIKWVPYYLKNMIRQNVINKLLWPSNTWATSNSSLRSVCVTESSAALPSTEHASIERVVLGNWSDILTVSQTSVWNERSLRNDRSEVESMHETWLRVCYLGWKENSYSISEANAVIDFKKGYDPTVFISNLCRSNSSIPRTWSDFHLP